MQLWPVKHFFEHRYPFVMKKVSELHLSEVTSYKIHTLILDYLICHFKFNKEQRKSIDHIWHKEKPISNNLKLHK